MEEHKLSVVLIAYNEERYIANVLSSLAQQATCGFEIIVVDSNSSDGTQLRAKEFSGRFAEFKYLILKETRGPGYARNRGAEICSYERILFLDADTMFHPTFLADISLEFSNKGFDVATCPLMVIGGGTGPSFGAFFMNSAMRLFKPLYSVGYGACLMSRRSVHKKIGGFDEKLGICEDCDYIKRARRMHKFKFGILSPYFYTSDRRLEKHGAVKVACTYLKVHLYRMFTGREIGLGGIDYRYGNY